MSNRRKISVCIVTYNHELYIRACLEGVVSQQLSCDYEVVIGEDCSKDNTLAICEEFAARYPGIIKLLTTPVNMGMMKNGLRTGNACTGDYIAVCEGDDYWTDPHKLQRQFDFLEANPDYSMIAENGLVMNTVLNKESLFNTIPECDLQINDLLKKRQFPSASVLFRGEYLKDMFKAPAYAGDTFLWCYLATRGKVRYLPIVSSVYRRGMQGVVLSTNKVEWARLMENWNEEISQMLPKDFDRTIFNRRNYSEYLKAFFFSASVNDRKSALLSIKKCFHYQPVRTAITLSKFLVKKLRLAV
jgi:glycosyltransferase involved in cell wall biosynthesis